MADISLTEDGFVAIEINGTSVTHDLYAVWNKLYEISDATDGQPNSVYLSQVAEFMGTMGYGSVSHRLADRFADAIGTLFAAKKNADKGSSTPSSPDSSVPPS